MLICYHVLRICKKCKKYLPGCVCVKILPSKLGQCAKQERNNQNAYEHGFPHVTYF